MTKKRSIVFTIFLFSLAGLLILYSIWAVIYCHGYINQAVAAGQLVVSDSLYEVVSFYMSSCSQYVLFAVILITLGWIFMRSSSREVSHVKPAPIPHAKEDEELDEWFEEMEMNVQGDADNEEVNKQSEERENQNLEEYSFGEQP